MPLIVVNDLLFIWGSVGSVSINSCNVGMLEGEISWTGGGVFGGGGVWGEGIGVVWGAVFVPFVDGLEGVQL